MKAAARSKISRRETRVHDLINTVEASANKVNSEEMALFEEGVGSQLSFEAHILDTEIDELAILDPRLADRAEKLRCATTASAVKAIGSVRKFRSDDGAASKCSAGSFVPKTNTGARSAPEEKEKSASDGQPPKSDAQWSKDASEARFPRKKSSAGRECKKREQSPLSEDGSSSGSDEFYSMASEDAEGYDRERQKYNNNGTHGVLYCFLLQLLFFFVFVFCTDTIAGGDR